jgi:hypothetical protein
MDRFFRGLIAGMLGGVCHELVDTFVITATPHHECNPPFIPYLSFPKNRAVS